ncbi:hypothetical protein K1W69_02695 [Hoeflea sp. WL0058]|uniref:Uncharacterized protein n=1 Tax=Flavimaribacter sediminis TaxID=2865987 RepID=A0AAE3CZU5_9HYPH|nr:hypothetical protein [Flavimaribacter sediminis]MBW8636081.1 hypothetical protein [Flavimaribacter sediminis]
MSPKVKAIIKNGLIGLVGGVIGAYLVLFIGGGEGYNVMAWLPIAGLVGGAVGGYLKASRD